jgi:hypothetical protein
MADTSVKIQGVDGVKFDDTYINGQKVNLALGKDTRPFKIKYAFFMKTVLPLIIAFFLVAVGFIMPMLTPVAVPATFSVPFMFLALLFTLAWKRKRRRFLDSQKAILDSPKYQGYNRKASEVDFAPSGLIDDVEKVAPNAGDGVFFFGHELFTTQEIHVADSKVRTHIIIFGTTGSGKTENILSICVNFLTQASGFILIDGKGDTLLFAKTFSLCRAYGRSDDVYLLNFMSNSRKGEKTIEVITNKFNFFVDSNSEEASEIVGGLLPSDSDGGGGMWESRAATGIESLNKGLYYLKDNGYIEIDPDTYRSYFSLDEFVALAMNEEIPKPYRAGLHTILKSINYKVPTTQEPNPKQNPATEEQFQYITMQYTSTFNMLAEQYSHITVSQVPDISITDIVLRRRILLVLLPSLAKSDQSVRNLGRIMIAMTRNVSSKAIGDQVEGNIETTIESKPTAAISSYGLIFDEFGAYATKGASTLPAQVRSLNMVCIFAGQDYEAFKKGDEIEAATIFANCTIKICMKLEDPSTYEKFKESAGQTYVMVQESFENKESMFGRKHVPAETARIEKRDVIDIKDLKDQGPGQETFIYGAKTLRAQAFYADPKLTKKARILHMLEIRSPNHSTVMAMREGVDGLYRQLRKRIDGDWEKKEEAIQRSINRFSPFKDEIMEIFGQVESYSEANPGVPTPNHTEVAMFAVGAYLKRVELVDHNISKALHESLGYEHDDEFDDAELLGDTSEDMEGFFDSSSGDMSLDPRFEDVPSEEPSLIQDSDNLQGEKVRENDTQAIPIVAKEDVSREFINEEQFLLIERTIDEKQQRLSAAVQKSFNTLEAIDMSVFNTQKHIQQLEEVLLLKQGVKKEDAQKLSQLTASNLTLDMGLKTNPAAVSDSERKVKSSARSSQEVKSMIDKFTSGI